MSLNSLRKSLMRSRSTRSKRARKASRRMTQSRQLRCEALEDRRLLSVVPNDPLYPDQWPLHNTGQTGGTADVDIDAPAAWSVSTGDTSMAIGVLDTGIDYTHEDLYLNIWLNQGEIPTSLASSLTDTDADGLITYRDLNAPANAGYVSDTNATGYIDAGDLLADPAWADGVDTDGNGYADDISGWDFLDNDSAPYDTSMHGTFVAGILGALGDNGVGVAGILWDAQIMPLRFNDGYGAGTHEFAAEALNYAVANGATVSNHSYGNDPNWVSGYSETLRTAIENAAAANHVVVAAAGNTGLDSDDPENSVYPADYELDNIISVAITDHDDQITSNSTYGATTVDLGAPGALLWGTVPGGYQRMTGTGASSWSAPHVTGVVALVQNEHPEWTYNQVIDKVLATVDPCPSLQGKTASGGRLNAAAAVDSPIVEISEVSIDDAIATEGGTALQLVDDFVTIRHGGLHDPRGIGFDSNGDLFVASSEPAQILQYRGSTGEFVGVFADASEEGSNPWAGGLEFDDNYIYVTTGWNSGVLRFDAQTGVPAPAAGKPGATFVSPGAGGLSEVWGMAVGPDGHLYVGSFDTDNILRFDGATGELLDVFVAAGSGGLGEPAALIFDTGGLLYVGSSATDEVLRYQGPSGASPGAFVDAFVPAQTGGLDGITGLTFGPDGDLYVSSFFTDEVLRYNGATGGFVDSIAAASASTLDFPVEIAFDDDGKLYAASCDTHRVLRSAPVSHAVFTASLSIPSRVVPVAVDFNTIPDTATAGTDYVYAAGTLTFAPGETSKTIIVPTVDDNSAEPDETFTVTLSNPVGGASIADELGQCTIHDDDQPEVLVSPSAGLVTTEYGVTDEFDVVLNRAPSANVTVDLSSSLPSEALISTATSGDPAANLSLTFTPQDWDAPQTVTVTGVDDGIEDGDIAYAITLSAASTDVEYDNISIDDVSGTNFDFDSIEVQVEAFIDGRDQLILQDNTAQWHHFDYYFMRDFPTIISTKLNGHAMMDGFEWYPEWPEVPNPADPIDFETFSAVDEVLFPALPSTSMDVALEIIESRDATEIIQNPSAANEYTTILEFDDNITGGAAWYTARLTFTEAMEPVLLAADDFESGDFSGGLYQWDTGSWTVSGDAAIQSGGGGGGSYHARLRDESGELVRAVDTTGIADVQLSFSSRLNSLESGDTAVVQVSPDGATWTTVHTFVDGDDNDQYQDHQIDVIDVSDTLYVRFDAQMSESGWWWWTNHDEWYLDDIQIAATALDAPPNQPPAITSTPVTTATEDAAYTYDVEATDPDAGDTLTFSLDTSPGGMTIDSTTGLIEWTPTNAHVGANPVTVRVADAASDFDTQSFSIDVTNTNDAPTITSTPVTVGAEGSLYEYDVQATDPDVGDTLTFSLVTAPTEMTIDSGTGLISWIPALGDVGDHPVEVKVEDTGSVSDTQTYTISVSQPNYAPEITAIDEQSATEDVLFSYDVEATDPNTGDTLTFSLDSAPAGMTIDANSGLIEWTPGNDAVGSHSVTVRVEDQLDAADTESFDITVTNVDDAPAITSTPVTWAIEDALYTYDVQATDPDEGDTLTFSLDTSPAGMTIDAASGLIEWTPTNAQVGDNAVTVQVQDVAGATDTQSFTVEVAAAASGPKLAYGVVSGVGSSGWTTVTLSETYTSMVVIATPNYDSSDDPGVTRIRNVSDSSFEVRLDAVGGDALSGIDVHYVVVEEGVYTEAEHGITMEAVKFTSTVTDENNSWTGEARSYANAYSDPVVVGQVMSYNEADPDWSVFWAHDGSRTSPPSSTSLVVGKQVAEDGDTTRADETIGYLVIESGSGTVGETALAAAVGADSIRGVTDSPPYAYSVIGVPNPEAAVASSAGMDGGNGGWPLLYGSSPVASGALQLAIDEDVIGDTERNHTTEQVAYLVFGEASQASTPNLRHGTITLGSADGWQSVTLDHTYDSMVVVATPNYDNTSAPASVRVQNTAGDSFEIRVDPANSGSVSDVDVHYVVVEEGVYNEAGFQMEAVKFDTSAFDRKGAWSGEARGYGQAYDAPVVVGQVMSYNDPGFSEFWANGGSQGAIPTSTDLRVGRHFGEDPDYANRPSVNETIGYLVVESASSGTIEGLPFVAGVGSDTVRGMTNGPSFDYTYTAMENSKTAIATLAAMDGGDGGWAVLYGTDPITPTGNTLRLAVDEDQLGDSDRGHTTEQVAYFIIDPPIETKSTNTDVLGRSPGRCVTALDALLVVNRPNSGELSKVPDSLDVGKDRVATRTDAVVAASYLTKQPVTTAPAPLPTMESRALDALDELLASLADDEDENLLEDKLLDLLLCGIRAQRS